MNETVNKKDKYIAATGYLFELGYFLNLFLKEESEFIKFHFEQTNKIIKKIVLPSLAFIVIGAWLNNFLSPYFVIIGVAIFAIAVILMAKGAFHALKGQKK